MDVADGIGQYIGAQISAATYDVAGGNVFVDHQPAAPDLAYMLRDTGGEESSVRLGYDEPSVQVIVRGPTVVEAKTRADEVYSLLQGLRGVALPDGTWVVLCRGVQSSPILLGTDDENRTEYSLNFALETRNATTHRS